MSKAIITTGGKQYLVSVGDVINVELVKGQDNKISFDALMTIDDKGTSKIGTPFVNGVSVQADLLENVRADKVTSIRYKAKKRVHKLHGHRQHLTTIKITKIS